MQQLVKNNATWNACVEQDKIKQETFEIYKA